MIRSWSGSAFHPKTVKLLTVGFLMALVLNCWFARSQHLPHFHQVLEVVLFHHHHCRVATIVKTHISDMRCMHEQNPIDGPGDMQTAKFVNKKHKKSVGHNSQACNHNLVLRWTYPLHCLVGTGKFLQRKQLSHLWSGTTSGVLGFQTTHTA